MATFYIVFLLARIGRRCKMPFDVMTILLAAIIGEVWGWYAKAYRESKEK